MKYKIIENYKIIPCTACRYFGCNHAENALLLVDLRYNFDNYSIVFDCKYKDMQSIEDIANADYTMDEKILSTVFVDDIPLKLYVNFSD